MDRSQQGPKLPKSQSVGLTKPERVTVVAPKPPLPKTQFVSLTKYERVTVVGVRCEQLARGAQAFVEVTKANGQYKTFFEIAEDELEARRLPLVVQRNMPDGKTENIRLASL
jgi:DNA-directed RNA polymerase subunit K/omega